MSSREIAVVADLMSKQVATVLAGEALRDAALLMDREDRGSLFVLEEDGSGRIEGGIDRP